MKKLFLFLLASTLFVGCNDDEVGTFGATQNVVGFEGNAKKLNYLTDVNEADVKVSVQLASFANEATLAAPVNVKWEIDESSTAVAGTDYDFADNTGGTVRIAPGTTADNIPFTVYPVNFDPANPKTIVLNLTSVSSNNAVIGSQLRQVVITLQGICPSNLEGVYSITYSSGTVAIFTITALGNGQYHSDTTMGWGTGQYWFEFTEVCGTISYNDWQFQSGYPMSGSGTVNDDGSITFGPVSIDGIYADRFYTVTPL